MDHQTTTSTCTGLFSILWAIFYLGTGLCSILDRQTTTATCTGLYSVLIHPAKIRQLYSIGIHPHLLSKDPSLMYLTGSIHILLISSVINQWLIYSICTPLISHISIISNGWITKPPLQLYSTTIFY